MIKTKAELVKKIEELEKEIKEYLFDNLDNFEFLRIDTHHVTYLLDGEEVHIWTSNGQRGASFYEWGIPMRTFEFDYTDDEKEILWKKAMGDIEAASALLTGA